MSTEQLQGRGTTEVKCLPIICMIKVSAKGRPGLLHITFHGLAAAARQI